MRRQQEAVPMGGPADLPRAQPAPMPLDAPSQRPDEPVTTGAAMGPGAGPEVLPGPTPELAAAADPLGAELRELYLEYPTEELRELIEDWDERQ